MAEKKYGLSKQESDRLGNLLSVANIQQELLTAVTSYYKAFLIGTVFKRLSVEPEMFQYSKINLGNGELIVDVPKKPKEEKK